MRAFVILVQFKWLVVRECVGALFCLGSVYVCLCMMIVKVDIGCLS